MNKRTSTGKKPRRSEKGVVLFLAISALVIAIPMVGLTVDVGFLYASKARLQAAVDGASLAAARALSLGATVADQKLTAQRNAVNWFYSNFAPGNWSTRSTIMTTDSVTVSTPSPSLSTIEVVATTRVPTYFMKWFHINDTLISSRGTANRRSVVVMMVLDRSYSMNTNSSCTTLISAAKLFTGQFAAGRDMIGMVSFSDGTYYSVNSGNSTLSVSSPTTNFRTNLGWDTGTAHGNGAIDNIQCDGGTGTAGAISIAYNELYKANIPGALNVLLIQTDGLPNSLAFDFWDSTNTTDPSALALIGGTGTGSNPNPAPQGCKDNSTGTNHPWTRAQGGWGTSTVRRNWSKDSPDFSTGNPSHTLLSVISSGMVGSIYSTDPANGNTFQLLSSPWHTAQNMGVSASGTGSSKYSTTTPLNAFTNSAVTGCKFATTDSDVTDFKRLPRKDLFGNDTRPATDPFDSTINMVQSDSTTASTSDANRKYVKFNDAATATRWTNFRKAVMNATDNAAFRARSNATLPAMVFVVGLGGNATGQNTPDYYLLQRMANDSNCDKFNQPINVSTGCGPVYSGHSMPTSFSGQPQGTLVYSSNANSLRSAFLTISSQILRLSQ